MNIYTATVLLLDIHATDEDHVKRIVRSAMRATDADWVLAAISKPTVIPEVKK